MGRVEDFGGDSVICDNPSCGKHERVPSGQIAAGWMRGELDGTPGQSYDVCGGNCALHVNKKLATDPATDYSMTWWSSKGEAAETAVQPRQVLPQKEGMMAETPTQQDPMQAVAFARITAIELGKDAHGQANACQQGGATLSTLADALAKLAGVFDSASVPNKVLAEQIRAALASIVDGVRAVGVVVQHAEERYTAHAQGWEREAQVWQSIMDGGTPKEKAT